MRQAAGWKSGRVDAVLKLNFRGQQAGNSGFFVAIWRRVTSSGKVFAF